MSLRNMLYKQQSALATAMQHQVNQYYYGSGTSNNAGGSLAEPPWNTVYKEWKISPTGITFTGVRMAKATDREYLIIDIDTNQILATAKTEQEADDEAANRAASTDHRITVFKPVATHAPEKKTTKKSITL